MVNKSKLYFLILLAITVFLPGCSQKVVISEPTFTKAKPDNIVLIIGDGMGLSHITAHIYQQDRSILQEIKDVGLVLTHSADNLVTDSGAGATAMSTGYKTNNNVIGKDMDGNKVESIFERANKYNINTGIVTTSSILDATPAAFFSHQDNRYYQDSVARDLLNCDVDIIIAGGKQFFDGTIEGSPYEVEDFEKRGFYVSHIWEIPIDRLPYSTNKRFLYFNGIESAALHSIGFDHLKESSKKALQYLSKKEMQFILMIEGAQIDWASHAGRQDEVLLRMQSFERAVEEVLRFARKDKNTLVIITADHTTGGLTIVDGSKPGDVKLNFSTNGHTGSMVPIFAYGPGSELFRGVMDNTDIYKKMVMLLNLPANDQNPVSAK